MKESTEVTTMLRRMCASVSASTANGGDCSRELYNQLISVDYPFTENDLWFIADSLGYTEDVFGAIICSKLVSSQSLFRMLEFASLNVNLCWLALHYYDSTLLRKKVTQAVQKKGLFHYKALISLINRSPFDNELNIHSINYHPEASARCYYA